MIALPIVVLNIIFLTFLLPLGSVFSIAVATTIEKILPSGSKNVKKIMFKTTMGKAIKAKEAKK